MTEQDIKKIIELEISKHFPVGMIFAFPTETIPENFLPCEGQELSKKQYPVLFALIGNAFGGTGTTFCLPDLQGQFIRGLDREGNVDYDEDGNIRQIGSVQQDAFQGHSHKFDPSVISMAHSGSHSHSLYWENLTFRDSSSFDSNNHKKDMPRKRKYYEDNNKYSWYHFDVEGTATAGGHTHTIAVTTGATPICDPVSSTYGSVEETVSTETRPTNVALIFCIKVK